jgi:DNA-binding NarL/FixJ family response regulator
VAIRVLIADDDPLARAVIEAMIHRDEELELVGSAGDPGTAVELAREHKPDVAVLDWVMPDGGGPQAARDILQDSPETKIVAFTASDSIQAEVDMLRAGAGSVLVKGAPPAEVLRTIRAAVEL